MPEAEPFMPIRHTVTGEITTTTYNAAARRILLQAAFEEAPGCACRATEPGTERTHEPARQLASCSSPAIPCTWAEPRPAGERRRYAPGHARSPMPAQSVARSESGQPLQPARTRTCLKGPRCDHTRNP